VAVAFLTEPPPPWGVALEVVPGIRRVVAPNPGKMTYHGTNTYLLDDEGGTIVVDPGPDDAGHVAAVLAASGRVSRIVITHTHHDHVGAAPALRAACGAPAYGFARSADPGFVADVLLDDCDVLAGWTMLHTPGHAADHLCLARADGVVLTADHVMGWSSSVVSPPQGDMAAYFASLRRMIARQDRLYLPGHGPAVPDPVPFVQGLLDHRLAREAAIVSALDSTPRGTRWLVDTLYSQVDPVLLGAAERNVISHLLKLEAEGRAVREGDLWRAGVEF
jgi:glyoxylase-like metal-dependent hydrolase (beta-lactamase superfamily II)